jgi:hypothetical protein
MTTRLVCLGLLAAASQIIATGCCLRPCHWRAHHPCNDCGPPGPGFTAQVYHPLLHPVLTRRALVKGDLGGPVGVPAGPVVSGSPVVMTPPCHGCETGIPVGYNGFPGLPGGSVVPVTSPPSISGPTPITPGPMVVPSYELPHPMPVKPGN